MLPPAPGLALHQELLPQQLSHPRAHDARDGVGRAASGEGHHDAGPASMDSVLCFRDRAGEHGRKDNACESMKRHRPQPSSARDVKTFPIRAKPLRRAAEWFGATTAYAVPPFAIVRSPITGRGAPAARSLPVIQSDGFRWRSTHPASELPARSLARRARRARGDPASRRYACPARRSAFRRGAWRRSRRRAARNDARRQEDR